MQSAVIKFTSDINPNFKNQYSIWYVKDDQIWQKKPLQEELPESEYQHLISKAELIDLVYHLFLQYQYDWTAKNLIILMIFFIKHKKKFLKITLVIILI